MNIPKSGIDVTLSGVQGVDWDMELSYHDEGAFPKRTLYLKSGTNITLSHNSRNVTRRGEGGAGDDGIIRYKVDREGNNTNYLYTGGSSPAYSGPFNFAGLTYEDGSSVVGGVGDNGFPVEDLANHWRKGVLATGGEEVHSLLLWDDDSHLSGHAEYKASDSAYYPVILNPKAPIIKFSGAGQFRTTLFKDYWKPVAYDQTTVFTGSINCTLNDLNGANVVYRINGGSFVDSGTSTLVLTQDDFATGDNTLEWYRAGSPGNVRSRKVVKDLAHPSMGESHGTLLTADWAAVLARIESAPYVTKANELETNNNLHGHDYFNYGDGWRRTSREALANAFVAKRKGVAYTKSGETDPFAVYGKNMLIDNIRGMASVGLEKVWPGDAIPNKESMYRGYWDVDPILSMAFGYDILIDIFRSDSVAGGITPVEDFHIRECLADWAHECLLCHSGIERLRAGKGMWGTCRTIGGVVCAMAMPTYTSEHYGTSGFDGNTVVALNAPYPNHPLTWKKVLYDRSDSVTLKGYPDLDYERYTDSLITNTGLFLPDGRFNDKIGYFEAPLCRHVFSVLMNLAAQRGDDPRQLYPHMWAGFVNATEGDFWATRKIDNVPTPEGPTRKAAALLMNSNFPELVANNLDWIQNTATGNETEDYQLYVNDVLGLVWYDINASSTPRVATPVITNLDAGQEDPATHEISSSTDGADIFYTLDDSDPSPSSLQYLGTFEVVGTTTIRAIAVKAGLVDSSIASRIHIPVADALDAPTSLSLSVYAEGLRMEWEDLLNPQGTQYKPQFSWDGGASWYDYWPVQDELVYLHGIPEHNNDKDYLYRVAAFDGVNYSPWSTVVLGGVDSLSTGVVEGTPVAVSGKAGRSFRKFGGL